jgi:hypothetical protein
MTDKSRPRGARDPTSSDGLADVEDHRPRAVRRMVLHDQTSRTPCGRELALMSGAIRVLPIRLFGDGDSPTRYPCTDSILLANMVGNGHEPPASLQPRLRISVPRFPTQGNLVESFCLGRQPEVAVKHGQRDGKRRQVTEAVDGSFQDVESPPGNSIANEQLRKDPMALGCAWIDPDLAAPSDLDRRWPILSHGITPTQYLQLGFGPRVVER